MDALLYILQSVSTRKFYVGHTTEPLQERLRKHNSNHRGFTGKFQDWILVHIEKFESRELDYQRELKLKSWKSKKRLQKLIADTEHQREK